MPNFGAREKVWNHAFSRAGLLFMPAYAPCRGGCGALTHRDGVCRAARMVSVGARI